MRVLLDTHTFIWWNAQSVQLPASIREVFTDRTNTLLLSLASAWEMQIKIQAGKLTLPSPLATIIEVQGESNNIQLLPIRLSHVLALEQLPSHHKDPFDRLLIAQARVENLTVISRDPIFRQYPVQVMW